MTAVMSRSGGAGRGAKALGDPPAAARTAGGVTLGVEEEFVRLDPSTGDAALAGPDLVRMLDGEPGVQQELMRFQVEIATGCAPAWTVSAASWSGCRGSSRTSRRVWAAAW